MDTYQAIYDAVRSKISGGDISHAVESAIRDCGIGHQAMLAGHKIQEVALAGLRPSVLYRPCIFMDGDQWCALYGDNLQDGVAGFGDSPGQAMDAFDVEWTRNIKPPEQGDGV